jgi:cytochrome P450
MTAAAPAIAEFDPQSRDYLLDPQAAVQRLFAEAPVFFHEGLNATFVLPYDQVRRALDDYETFSSQAYRGTPVRDDLRGRIPEEWERVGNVIQGGQLTNLDPPVHIQQRRAIQRTFTHRRVEEVKPAIEAIANELIDGLVERGECDVMKDFAMKLTMRVAVGELLDVPGEMLPGFLTWVADVFGVLSPIDMKAEDVTTPDEHLVTCYRRLYEAYVTYSDFVGRRRASPGADLASAMLTLTEEDGTPALTQDQVLGHMLGLTAAGTDTTAALITNMVRLFTEQPGQLRLVFDDPALWENAVQEGLRRSAIATQFFRVTTREAELGGVCIPARSNVGVSVASANADPAKFADPLRFDVRRENARDHVAFGHGRHHCLGAPLARPEARIALETLYRRLPDLKADLDQELDFVPSLTVRMVRSQRVTWAS